MSRETEQEDKALLTALEALELENPSDLTDEDPAAREYLEIFGRLPYALEPEAPPAGLRQRILQQIAGRASRNVIPLPRRSTAATSDREPQPLVSTARPLSHRWLPPVAATLLIALAGLVLLLALEIRSQQGTIATLVVQLEKRLDQQAETERLRDELRTYEQRLEMITTVAAGLYPLRPPQPAAGAGPRGVMYVCSNHQQWYLHLQNLEPSPEGQSYVLWFLTEEGPVEMDHFQIEEYGEVRQYRRASMPPGTRGVMVSLQPLGERASAPTGSVVLAGDKSVRL
jgi:hypothetical protein